MVNGGASEVVVVKNVSWELELCWNRTVFGVPDKGASALDPLLLAVGDRR